MARLNRAERRNGTDLETANSSHKRTVWFIGRQPCYATWFSGCRSWQWWVRSGGQFTDSAVSPFPSSANQISAFWFCVATCLFSRKVRSELLLMRHTTSDMRLHSRQWLKLAASFGSLMRSPFLLSCVSFIFAESLGSFIRRIAPCNYGLFCLCHPKPSSWESDCRDISARQLLFQNTLD